MSENQLLPDDPRLTAYGLGELDPTEQDAIERLLANSPAAQAAVEEIRGVATLLTNELRQEPAPELTDAQRSFILAGSIAAVPVPQVIPPRPLTRRAARWISRFAAMAAMVALVAVAAFLPAPGNKSRSPLTSESFVNGGIDGLGREQQFDFAMPLSDSTEGLEADVTSLSRGGWEVSVGAIAGGGREYISKGEVLQRDGSARFGGSGQLGQRLKPASRKYDAGQGENQHTNGHFTGIGNTVSEKAVSDFDVTGGSRLTNRPIPPAPESPQVELSRTESEKEMPLSELAVTSKPASGSGSQPAKGPKVKKKQSGMRIPPAVSANAVTGSAGMGGPGNGGGGGGLGGAGGHPGPVLETDRYSDDFNYSPARKGAISEWEAKRLANGESRRGRDNRQKDSNGNELAEGLISRSQTLSTDRLELKEDVARRSSELFLGTEAYEPIVENPFLSSYENPLSTFGVDVDTASYANMRRFLTQQQLPPPNAVRIEELVNYFSYDYPQPAGEQPFSVNVEAGRCPWNPGNGLVRIGLKGKEIDASKRPASNLVFLVDVSGSMQPENKLPLVKMGLNLLTQQMTESDRVAIVTYSDTAVQRLESTNGTNKPAIQGVIDALQAGGSTNGAGGIQLAYRAALDHFVAGGTNRVILCTDGDFNVGVTGDDELVQLIQERARTKVFFSVLGFGMGNLKDGKLEKLADKGNGQYAYIDSQREARKVFVDDLAGTLVTIAKDVKLQVEFNPNQVGAYRLIGYENRVMAAQDFNNDAKDAGDIGAGHTVTALYETLPAGEAPKSLLGDTLRYRAAVVPQEGGLAHELLTVKLRYKLPEADTSTLVEVPVNVPKVAAAGFGDGGAPPPRTGMSADFNWSASVAAFGMILRGSQFRGQANFDMVLELAQGAKGEDKSGRRQEFIDLVKSTKALYGGSPAAGVAPIEPPATTPLTREQAEAKATVNGKYKNLLRIVEAPGDSAAYGSFHEYGRWEGTSYLNHNDLPQGYWVYVAPNWYIWGDK